MNIPNSRERLESMILFLATICGEQQRFGKTKLYKLLYYAEANAKGMLGRPISDCTFVKQPHGPVPLDIDQILAEMEAEGKIRMVDRPLAEEDHREIMPLPLVEIQAGVLTAAQLDLLRLVANRYWFHSARRISLQSHEDIPGWNTLKPDGAVPVGVWHIVPDPPADPKRHTEALLDAVTTRYHEALLALA